LINLSKISGLAASHGHDPGTANLHANCPHLNSGRHEMQVVESAVPARVATPEPKHATPFAPAAVKVVPPLAVTEAILQGDCCTTTASAEQAMILRHDRYMQDPELACLNRSYSFGRSKKLPAARDAERHLHCRLVLTVLLPADRNFDRYFRSIEGDGELDAIRLSFRDLRCSH
jgi:hypothetical protein